MRRTIWLVILLAVMLMLTACSPLAPTQTEFDAVLPTPLPALAPIAPTTDGLANETARVSLMYPSADGQQLVPQARRLWLTEGTSLVEQVVGQLLTAPQAGGLKAIAPTGTRLLMAEVANGVATIDLSSEARNQTQRELAAMRVALANTLTGLEGIDTVNILIGGQVEGLGDRISAMPSGALTRNENSLAAIWVQMQADEERFAAGQDMRQLDVNAVLYLSSNQGERVVPEARQIRLTSDDIVMVLLRELRRDPLALREARAVFPDGMEPLLAPPTITTLSDGRRVVNLLLNDSFESDMSALGLSLRQFYAALTLTVTGFVPEVDGLAVRVGNRRVTSVEGSDGVQAFDGGVMEASDFRALVGDVASIYLRDGDGKLVKCGRVMDPYSATHPRTLIEQLMAGPLDAEPGLLPVSPEGVSPVDVLAIHIENGVALVNLSSNFYRCAQQLDEVGERLLIYAIVNTLTDLSGVQRVRFYIEGEVVDSLAHGIYLRTELIRNPGMIAR